jgi:hypothetical protein
MLSAQKRIFLAVEQICDSGPRAMWLFYRIRTSGWTRVTFDGT